MFPPTLCSLSNASKNVTQIFSLLEQQETEALISTDWVELPKWVLCWVSCCVIPETSFSGAEHFSWVRGPWSHHNGWWGWIPAEHDNGPNMQKLAAVIAALKGQFQFPINMYRIIEKLHRESSVLSRVENSRNVSNKCSLNSIALSWKQKNGNILNVKFFHLKINVAYLFYLTRFHICLYRS